jgi:rubrerythrin
MEEKSTTASAIISFAENLEDSSARFYRELADRFGNDRETFSSFANESEKNKLLVTRTYQETITDALEACFSFKGLDQSRYLTSTDLTPDAGYSTALKTAIELEDKASEFYFCVAEMSRSLLATIPRAFKTVAERRRNRKSVLKALLDKVSQK